MQTPQIKISGKTFSAVSLAVIGAAIVLLIAGVTYYIQQEKQRQAIEVQSERTNQLITEVKDLSEQNRRLNEQNREYAYCNAVLLAKYTQTQEPIIIEDLEKCTLTSFKSEEKEPQEKQPNSQASNNQSQPQQSIMQSQGPESTTRPIIQVPTNAKTPQSPEEPINETSTPSNNLLDLGDSLEVNTPCINVLGLIKTCSE